MSAGEVKRPQLCQQIPWLTFCSYDKRKGFAHVKSKGFLGDFFIGASAQLREMLDKLLGTKV